MWMRRSLLIAAGTASVLLPLTAAGAAPDPVPAAPEPTVPDAVFPLVAYTEPGLGGASQAFGSGVFDAGSGGLGAVGDDAISSLRVAEGYRVLACDRTAEQSIGAVDGLGACRYFDAGWYDRTGGGLNDRISLLTVVAAPEPGTGVTVYGEPGFAGGTLRLGPGRHEADTGDFARLDTVGSLKVEPGHQAVLCDSPRSTAVASGNPGLCEIFGAGEHAEVGALTGVASLVMIGGSAVTAYAEPAPSGPAPITPVQDVVAGVPAAAGAAQEFGGGIFQASTGQLAQVGNDAITSLRVGAGWRVLACGDDHAAPATLDDCTLFEAGRHDLTGTALDDGISLLAVSAGPASGDLLTAYDDQGLQGLAGGFGPGMYGAADLGPVGNDAISSLRLLPGARAVLCADEDAAPGGLGDCRLFAAGDHLYVGKDLNDKTSLLAVAP